MDGPLCQPSEQELRFNRLFKSWEECRPALVSFGFEPQRVDGWRTEKNPRVFQKADGTIWSSINPHAMYLAGALRERNVDSVLHEAFLQSQRFGSGQRLQ